MLVTTYQPSPLVAQRVSGILVIRHESNEAFRLPLFANGTPTLVFQTAPAEKGNEIVGNLTLYGQTVRPDELAFGNAVTIIAYFLQPHILQPLLNAGAGELTDGHIDLEYLSQARNLSLQEQLLEEQSVENRLRLIDGFIAGLPIADRYDFKRADFATSLLRNSKGLFALPDLQDKLNMTERSMQRLFEAHVGMSPKLFRRICQFDAAFQQLNYLHFGKLSDVAFENGYADQSHFIRIFKEFTGQTPKEYLAKRSGYDPVF